MTELTPVKEAVSDDLGPDSDAARDGEKHGQSGQEESADDDSHVPHDKGWAWVISISCFIIFFVYCTFDQVLSVLLMDIMKELDTTVSVISVMFSLNTWFYCISTQLTTNVFLKYISNRSLETAAAFLNVLATLMFTIHPSVELLLTASFIKATSRGTAFVPTVTMVGYYFRKRLALAIALGLLGASVCSVTVPPLARYLRDEYGTRGCFLLISGVELQAVLATMLLRPISSYSGRRSRVQVVAAEGSDEEKKVLMPRTLRPQLTCHSGEKKEVKSTHTPGVSGVIEVNTSGDSPNLLERQKISNLPTNPFITDEHSATDVEFLSKCNIQPNDVTDVTDVVESRTNNTIKRGTTDDKKRQLAQQNSNNSKSSFQYDECNTESTYTIISKESSKILQVPRKDQADISMSRPCQVKWSSTTSSILGSAIDISSTSEPPREPVKPPGGQSSHRKLTMVCSWINVIINFKLLKNLTCVLIFCIYCLINVASLTMVYLPSYARKVGVLPQDAALLLTIIGTCDVGARMVYGFIVDSKLVKVNIVMAVAIFCQGVVSQFLGMFLTFEHLIFYSVSQGFLGSVGPSLDTMLIVETLGIEFLSKVLPMCSLFLGVTTAVQQLFIGALIETTGNFVVAFNYVGTMYILAAVLLLCVPLVKRLQVARETKNFLSNEKH